jgi:putative ABC transport system permease protein
VFRFTLGPQQLLAGLVLALILGVVGGFFPALRAARTPILKIGSE